MFPIEGIYYKISTLFFKNVLVFLPDWILNVDNFSVEYNRDILYISEA